MPSWSHDIPKDPRGPSFPIVRTPAFKPLMAIVTSQDLVGCFTHFFHGRTIPHEDAGCEACHEGIPFRWHAYQSIYQPETAAHLLFECTAASGEAFTEYRDKYHTLRGCKFEARRMNSKPNGRILIRTRPADLAQLILPKPPDLVKCLSILWDLPCPDLTTNRINPEKKTTHVAHQSPSGNHRCK